MRSREEIINTIFRTPWHIMRWVRLIIGIWAITNFVRAWEGAQTNKIEYLILLFACYFLYKALFNTGCEVIRQQPTGHVSNEEQIEYTEIK